MKWADSGGNFEKAPTGSHLARCYALIDMGTQAHTFQGDTRMQRDVRISFELPLKKMTGEFNPDMKGKPYSVHVNVKQSLHTKANLRRLLEGWRGKKFDADSIAKFDPKKLVGGCCRLALVENGDYTNVDSISPATKEEQKSLPKSFNKPLFLSLDPDEFDEEAFKTLSEKTRQKIAGSPEYKALHDGGSGEEPQEDPTEGHGGEPPEDSEVPF